MKKVLRGALVALVSCVLVLTTILFPFNNGASASFTYTTEAGLKSVLKYLAYYDCINQYGQFLQETAIGNSADSILQAASSVSVWVGTWLAPGSGMMSCSDAIKAVHPSGITASMLNSGSIFSGVYEYSTTNEKKIKCNYQIVNSEATGYISGTYSWPQGYYNGDTGLVDARSHGVIWVVYDSNGPIRTEPAYNDVNPDLVDAIKQWRIDWSDDSKICTNLVKYTEVYKVNGENIYGEPMVYYTNIEATDDATPLNEWPFDLYDGKNDNDAWCNNANGTFTHTVEAVTDNTKLVLTSNAKEQLKKNISDLYLDGATDLNGILSKSANLKYMLYGRYLFNGDGGYADGCNGTTIKAADSSKVDPQFWDTSLSYVSSISAYESSSASSKTNFITKFGGNGLAQAGSARDVSLPGGYYSTTYMSCADLASAFNGVSVSANLTKGQVVKYMGVSEVEELPETNDPDPSNPGGGSTGGGTKEMTEDDKIREGCFHEAGSMGWIICPMIFGMRDAADSIYEKHIVPLLKVDKSTISQLRHADDEHAGLYKSWSAFRDFANIIFVGALLIVIFSQITGFGIDNYGVKRMLPKLIIGAVLVNLSFIICALVVDASNIVGAAVKNLFESLAANIPIGTDVGAAGYVSFIITSLVTVLGASLGVASVISAASAGAGWTLVLPILMFLLGAIISVLFIFVTLGARQALIIVMIAISPLAMVMYLLPNTNGLFKKWIKLFEGLILVYPIVGLLVGGGYLASRVILSGDPSSFFLTIVAGLAAFVPYFFIPSVVSNAMKGMGNLGGMIQGFGKGLRGGLDRGIRNTEGFKAAEQRRIDAKNLGRARRDFKRFTEDDGTGKRVARKGLKGYQAQRLASASGVITGQDRSVLQAKASMGASSASASSLAGLAADYNRAETEKAVQAQESRIKANSFTDRNGALVDANNIASSKEALIQEIMQEGNGVDSNKIDALTNHLSAQGDDGRAAVEEAMVEAERRKAAMGKTVDAGARQAYAKNIMNKWAGDYKSNRRAVYEFAAENSKSGVTGAATSMSHFTSPDQLKYKSLKGSTISSMDDQEFERMRDNLSNVGATEQASFSRAVEDAFRNEGADIKDERAVAMAAAYADMHGISHGTDVVKTVRDHIRAEDAAVVNSGGGAAPDPRMGLVLKDASGQLQHYQVYNAPQGFEIDNSKTRVSSSGDVMYFDREGNVFNASKNILKPKNKT